MFGLRILANAAWFLLSVAPYAQLGEYQGAGTTSWQPSYHILEVQSGKRFYWTYEYYYLSIDERMSEEKFKKLICYVMKNEKAGGRDVIVINVYYRVKSHLDPENFESIRNLIGTYTFDAKIGPEKRIAFFQDEAGKPFKPRAKFVAFDHRNDCQ